MPVCEICGSEVKGQLKPVEIDGAVFRVCFSCLKLGSPVKPKVKQATVPKQHRVKPPRKMLEDELELRGDYSVVIREAREKMRLSQEELGMRIGEKASVIRLLEAGKLIPDNLLTKKLEHFLRIKLLVPIEELEGEV